MSGDNPFSQENVAASDRADRNVYRDGTLLVVPKQGAVFSYRCLKTNRPWQGELTPFRFHRSFSEIRRPPQAVDLAVPLDPQWLRRRRTQVRTCWWIFAAAIGSLILAVIAYVVLPVNGFASERSIRWLMLVIFLSPPVSLVALARRDFWLREPFALRRATDTHVWIAGVHPDYLATLRGWRVV